MKKFSKKLKKSNCKSKMKKISNKNWKKFKKIKKKKNKFYLNNKT